jgi:6-pyruvoyltetrahydropterin/6-carboxytetrahydropterin synthase
MYTLTVEETFAAAHQLRGYRGKCENMHGHTWKAALSVAGEKLNDIGLLVDFQEIKAVLREITAMFDHKDINGVQPFDAINPSSENLSKFFYDEAVKRFATQTPALKVVSAAVWESPVSYCVYTESD